MKHTDGPWEVGKSGLLVFAGSILIADCDPNLGVTEEDPEALRGNARIMAAALEMKEALSEAAEFLHNGTPIHPGSYVANSILVAFSKAGGES